MTKIKLINQRSLFILAAAIGFLMFVRPTTSEAAPLYSVSSTTDNVTTSTDTVSISTDTVSISTDTISKSTDTVSISTDTVSISTDTVSISSDTVSISTDTLSPSTGTVCLSTPSIYFATGTVVVSEEIGLASIKVVRGGGMDCASQVGFYSKDGTARHPLDYASVLGTLTFLPGESVKFLEVSIKDDQIPEPAEELTLHLTNPVNAVLIHPKDLTLLILDTDKATSTDTVVQPVKDVFKKFVNVGNPGKKPMTIKYEASPESAVQVTVYNMQGELIRELHPENGETVWDGRNSAGKPVASDVYYVVLKAGDKVSKKKVVIIR